MKKYLVINDSKKRAKRKITKVNNGYLQRIANRAWLGELSSEMLKFLCLELGACASKNALVKVIDVSKGKLVYSLGGPASKEVVFKRYNEAPAKKKSPYWKKLIRLARLSSLAHDIGKNNKKFQGEHLLGQKGSNEVRHEIVSILKLLELWGVNSISEDSELSLVLNIVKFHHAKKDEENTLVNLNDLNGLNPLYQQEFNSDELTEIYQDIRNIRPLNSLGSAGAFDYIISRAAMMSADYCVSSLSQFKRPVPLEKRRGRLFANTNRKAGEDFAFLEPLPDHLRNVERQSEKMVRAIFKSKKYPKIAKETVLKMDVLKAGANSPFYWQNLAVSSLKEAQITDEDGFFGVLAAGTGRGKTQGAVKILREVSPEGLRFSFTVGFGSLAAESGEKYIDEIGFSKTECLTMVGKSHLKKEQNNIISSEEEREFFANSAAVLKGKLPSVVEELVLAVNASKSKSAVRKSMNLLKAPVLAMTLDHLTGVMNTTKGSNLLPLIRVATADLLIDEIDSFSFEDLAAIGRLIYFSGLFGRKVVIASATITSDISQKLYTAYEQGFAQRKERLQHEGELYSGYYSEFIQVTGKNFPQDSWKEHSRKLVEHPGTDKLSLVEIDGLSGIKKVLTGSVKAKTFLVRLNNISQIRTLFQELVKSFPDDIVVPFHNMLDVETKHQIDSSLKEILNRKNEQWKSHPRTPLKHQRLIVISSPLIEVGKDFDFDTVIVEPSDLRGLIQSAGRCHRHRDDSATVYLLKNPLNLLNQPLKAIQPYSRPGFLTGRHLSSRVIDSLARQAYTANATDLFGINESEPLSVNSLLMQPKESRERRLKDVQACLYLDGNPGSKVFTEQAGIDAKYSLESFLAKTKAGFESVALEPYYSTFSFRRSESQSQDFTFIMEKRQGEKRLYLDLESTPVKGLDDNEHQFLVYQESVSLWHKDKRFEEGKRITLNLTPQKAIRLTGDKKVRAFGFDNGFSIQ